MVSITVNSIYSYALSFRFWRLWQPLTENGARSQLIQDLEQFNPETVAVHIAGHTSDVGAANFNRKLSQDRAQAVADYLRHLGQLKHEIIIEGKGEDEPLPNMQPNDQRNQRTEIRLERKNNK